MVGAHSTLGSRGRLRTQVVSEILTPKRKLELRVKKMKIAEILLFQSQCPEVSVNFFLAPDS
jgi:hypothetical protein